MVKILKLALLAIGLCVQSVIDKGRFLLQAKAKDKRKRKGCRVKQMVDTGSRSAGIKPDRGAAVLPWMPTGKRNMWIILIVADRDWPIIAQSKTACY
jgi:hypothetical protein